MARSGDSAVDDPNNQNQNQTGYNPSWWLNQTTNPTGSAPPGGMPAAPGSSSMPAYDPNNPSTWVEPTQPGGTGAAGAPTPTVAPPSSGGTPPPVSGPGATGAQGAPFGGFNNIPGQFGQIFGGLPQAPNTSVPIPQPDAYEQQLRNAIMAAIQQGGQPVTQNDPLIAPVIQAMQGQAQRGMEQNAQQVGERMYAQGLPVSGGGYDSRVLGFNQLTNEATQGNIAQTMLSQLNDRQNRLMTALNLGSNYLNAEQSRVLQAELANVSNALSAYGMKSNTAQGILAQLLGNAQYYSGLGTNANQFAQNQNNQSVNNPL